MWGAWPAANAQSRTSTLIAWNVNTQNPRVRVHQIVCECAKKERQKATRERVPFGGNANAL